MVRASSPKPAYPRLKCAVLPLAAALAASGSAVAACARDPRLDDFDFRQAAFLDTETSGLAGGAGTFAFMVGIGMFEGEGDDTVYVVRQVFMRSPAEERALLEVTANLLARCEGLVSFNGRAFDVPLLTTRYALQRQPSPLIGLPHFDLLPAARQRWRLRLPSCALSALERDILEHPRSQEDVPGWLIPSLYSDYARSAASGKPVGHCHRRHDPGFLPQQRGYRQHGAAGGHTLFALRGNRKRLCEEALHPVDMRQSGPKLRGTRLARCRRTRLSHGVGTTAVA